MLLIMVFLFITTIQGFYRKPTQQLSGTFCHGVTLGAMDVNGRCSTDHPLQCMLPFKAMPHPSLQHGAPENRQRPTSLVLHKN